MRVSVVIPAINEADNLDAGKVKRIVFCSGKVYFDLVKAKPPHVAIARLEQLYPLPMPELMSTLQSFPKLQEVYWVQEEPKNSGAWRYLLEPLMGLVDGKLKLRYAGRPESASPATGFPATHAYEQKQLVEEAMAKG